MLQRLKKVLADHEIEGVEGVGQIGQITHLPLGDFF